MCPLRNYEIWLSKKLCTWKGDIEDYITHVKTCHPENYFEIQESGKFMWKLPKQGDQQDIAVIKKDSSYYLYEMYYANNSGKLYFSLHCYCDETASSKSYVFCLENSLGNGPAHISKISSVKELLMPINERSCIVQLSKNEVRTFLGYYRHFTWKLALL